MIFQIFSHPSPLVKSANRLSLFSLDTADLRASGVG